LNFVRLSYGSKIKVFTKISPSNLH